ncbi:glutaredoxin family protein [Pseudomonas fluorescens]|uniref:Putative glutaredoxin n=1 Tax=Pseudomonas fluorescens (strain Pf0-1) TaxID=205922 RepID=Q3KHN1_PSEPF|nr:glutaredoxin family protein [Pseudomonas fluorescens]ABA72725.1 putative glutaredoxin [Pseudomonas fluorescens Pf0-1]MBY9023070.1 glutaredoxin family protein [Pseudomonas fluorescens]MBY9029062.1 glutaredoxin family protein [Pseudomonas fluorescens]MBY9034720.1 glutaredoxin family protein [Pseudomonas fluorescens]MBY9040713.1 glutaredoxin family protein [Pseudomonas fluorescens]
MLGNVLKKVALVLLVVVVYQNWGKIERVFNPSQVASEHVRANAHVVLYATDWCGYCKQTKRFLDQKGIAFKEFDIEKDAEARKAYEALGGRGIPLIDVNGTLIRGFDPDEILAALK